MINVIENASREEILKFKLACKSTDELTDAEIWTLFLNFELHDEKEIVEMTDILKQYRPELFRKLNDAIK